MTREEAIKTLHELWRETNDPWYEEVYNMAIEALKAKTDGDIISRQDAIDAICKEWCYVSYDNCPHCDDGFTCDGCDDVKAIESLTPTQSTNIPTNTPTDLISRADLFNELATVKASPEANEYKAEVYMVIQALPSAEAVEVVRCRDCKYWREWENRVGSCHRSENRYNWFGVDSTDYCSFGERREDGEA